MTLQSPRIFREQSLPTLKEVIKIFKDAGIPSHLHSCGRERYIIETAVYETDLSSIEQLESPQGGDYNLAEMKRFYGDKIALKGNIKTTRLLMASLKQVDLMAKECIDTTKESSGYVLSTGDPVGRDTLDENIYAIIKVAKKYGKY